MSGSIFANGAAVVSSGGVGVDAIGTDGEKKGEVVNDNHLQDRIDALSKSREKVAEGLKSLTLHEREQMAEFIASEQGITPTEAMAAAYGQSVREFLKEHPGYIAGDKSENLPGDAGNGWYYGQDGSLEEHPYAFGETRFPDDEYLDAWVDVEMERNAKAHGLTLEEYESKVDGLLEEKFGNEYGILGRIEGTYVESWKDKEVGDSSVKDSSQTLEKSDYTVNQNSVGAKSVGIPLGVIVAAIEAIRMLRLKSGESDYKLSPFMDKLNNSFDINAKTVESVELDTQSAANIREKAADVEAENTEPDYEMEG